MPQHVKDLLHTAFTSPSPPSLPHITLTSYPSFHPALYCHHALTKSYHAKPEHPLMLTTAPVPVYAKVRCRSLLYAPSSLPNHVSAWHCLKTSLDLLYCPATLPRYCDVSSACVSSGDCVSIWCSATDVSWCLLLTFIIA